MGSYQIEWRGNEFTNFSSREENIPLIIVNHIVDGTAESCDSWFRSSTNKQSSAHFLVTFKGEIKQYVRIEDMAWANGLKLYDIPKAESALVRSMKMNPNLYSVSIEHEGTTGQLTEEQFQATLWLHRYIQDYIRNKWGHEIPMDREHILGHFEIDPLRKANCPGKDFPWEKLIKELQKKSQAKSEQKWRYEGVEFLHKQGILNDLKGWKEKICEPMPVWAVCLLKKRMILKDEEKNIKTDTVN